MKRSTLKTTIIDRLAELHAIYEQTYLDTGDQKWQVKAISVRVEAMWVAGLIDEGIRDILVLSCGSIGTGSRVVDKALRIYTSMDDIPF